MALTAEGAQIKANWDSSMVLCKVHVGCAVTPAGISEGQLPDKHNGLLKSPEAPGTCTARSPDSLPVAGSS